MLNICIRNLSNINEKLRLNVKLQELGDSDFSEQC